MDDAGDMDVLLRSQYGVLVLGRVLYIMSSFLPLIFKQWFSTPAAVYLLRLFRLYIDQFLLAHVEFAPALLNLLYSITKSFAIPHASVLCGVGG